MIRAGVMIVCLLLMSGILGCQRIDKSMKERLGASSPEEVQDTGVTARISRIGDTKEFRLEVSYTGKRDMQWWVFADADLYDAYGKSIARPATKAGTSWFHWKEDREGDYDSTEPNHYGYPREDNPLVETLILDAKELPPGKYRAVPSVAIYEYGNDAHPKLKKDPYYRDMHGIKPGKVVDCWFTIR